jgi:hypothetical protein
MASKRKKERGAQGMAAGHFFPRLLYLVLSKNGAECLTSTQLHLENNLAAGYRSKCFTV